MCDTSPLNMNAGVGVCLPVCVDVYAWDCGCTGVCVHLSPTVPHRPNHSVPKAGSFLGEIIHQQRITLIPSHTLTCEEEEEHLQTWKEHGGVQLHCRPHPVQGNPQLVQ